MNSGWLTAYETRSLIGARRNAFTSAALDNIELSIIDNARTILPARCAFMRDKTLSDAGALDRHLDAKDVDVPNWAWNLTDDWKLDWNSGTFHLSGNHEGEIRYLKLVGVRFDRQAIDAIWPDGKYLHNLPSSTIDVESAKPRKSNSGRPRHSGWDEWIAYLVVAAPDILREEGTDGLINKVADLMAADGRDEMKRSTVQSAAQAVIALLTEKRL